MVWFGLVREAYHLVHRIDVCEATGRRGPQGGGRLAAGASHPRSTSGDKAVQLPGPHIPLRRARPIHMCYIFSLRLTPLRAASPVGFVLVLSGQTSDIF